jgi:ATP-dependent Clp protease ATP-binding subunit ClpX
LDNVELEFDTTALGAAADLALVRGTGARGLRSIIEKTLLDVMFEVPGRDRIRRVVIDKEAINGERRPRIYDVTAKELSWDDDGTVNDPARPAA